MKSKITDKVIAYNGEKEWIKDLNVQYKSRMVPRFYKLVNEPVKIDDLVEDRQEIRLLERQLNFGKEFFN